MVIEENAGQVKSTVQHRIKPERNSSAASGRMKDLTQNYYSSSSSSSSSSEGGPASSSSSSGPSDNLPPTPSPSLLPPVVQLDFNSLPMHAQLICLNELIRFHSDHSNQSSSSTAIIFTSLPPPENGTSSSFEGSARYLDQLESFLNDLPPVLAIYAKQFTVTFILTAPMDLAPHPCLSPDVPFTCPHVEYPAEQAVQSGMRQELVGQESSDGMYPSDPQITMKPPEYLPMEARSPPTEEQKRRLTIFSRITP
ncbi:hypothetical protein KEM48_010981 [Puccinia striiformis f. sp. tritici PST-130]|nr:hypothetical protein KEM48_010981 [Puccinia striiformis f. sp. tritici PST-130]